MPENADISLHVWWPLIILLIALVNQILAPHSIWLTLVIALIGLYGTGLIWIRIQAAKVHIVRGRTGSILVAGDTLFEDYELQNASLFPVLWAEFVDETELPGHSPGRVVACQAYSSYRWRDETICERRGVFRLGPHRLHIGDPFGLFRAEIVSTQEDVIIIYPRVAHLPTLGLPHGNSGESYRRRRPLRGTLPSASVTDYRPGDSVRQIHWRSTARRSRIMVKELEIEPSGDVWIVLDLNRAVQSGSSQTGTFEYGIVVAASMAAKLLTEGERRAVGLLAMSGGSVKNGAAARTLLVPPQPGRAQMWRILAALASAEEADISLANLLHNSREVLGNRRTLIVITAQTDIETGTSNSDHHVSFIGHDADSNERSGEVGEPEAPINEEQAPSSWLMELVHLRSSGLDASALLISNPYEQHDGALESDRVRGILATSGIESQVMSIDVSLRPALTFRRTRRVVRSTPTGGAVTYEVEEEVG